MSVDLFTQLPEQLTLSSADEDGTEHEFDEELDKMSEKDSDDDAKSKEDVETRVSFLTYFKFLWAFLNSTMTSMTRYLNRYSNDYRYVRKVLAKEKKLLKVCFHVIRSILLNNIVVTWRAIYHCLFSC